MLNSCSVDVNVNSPDRSSCISMLNSCSESSVKISLIFVNCLLDISVANIIIMIRNYILISVWKKKKSQGPSLKCSLIFQEPQSFLTYRHLPERSDLQQKLKKEHSRTENWTKTLLKASCITTICLLLK